MEPILFSAEAHTVVAEATTPAVVGHTGLSEQQRAVLLGIDVEPNSGLHRLRSVA